MRIVSIASVLGVILGCSSLAMAQPSDPTQSAIFAGRNLAFLGHCTVTGGPVVANGNVNHTGNVLTVPSLFAGGAFSTAPASYQNVQGDVFFGGDIVNLGGPGSVIGGNLTTGGSVTFLNSSVTVTGNVTAAHDVNQPFAFAVIGGDVTAGGNVNIKGTVNGNVTYGGTITLGTVHGTISAGGPVTPPAYIPRTLPAGRNLTPGTTDITLANFEDRTLAPGAYGNLQFATGNTLSLTAGQYVFASIASAFSLNELSIDTSNGPINVYVHGDLTFDFVQIINGEKLFPDGDPNPAHSKDIFMEVAGSFIGDSALYGTVFAPNGDITINSASPVTSRLLAGRDVSIHADVTVVPEPATLATLGLLSATFLRRRGQSKGRE